MAEFDPRAFGTPPKQCRPMVRWWWPGLDVDIPQLVDELRDMDERGFGGAEVQAFMIGSPSDLEKTDPGRYRRAHRFMRPFYYEALQAVLGEAERRGLTIDLTICSAWPAGGTHVTDDTALGTMAMGAMSLKGPKTYRGRLPRFPRPPITRLPKSVPLLGSVQSFARDALKPIRVVAARPLGRPGRVHTLRAKTTAIDIATARDITAGLQDDGTLVWEVPDGVWQVFCIYAGPSRTHPLYDAREEADSTSYVLDHLASGPVTELLERHFGRESTGLQSHMGNTFRAFFTDSLELAADWAWTPEFLAEFEARRGYDLTPYLLCCYIPARDNKYAGMIIKNRPPSFEFAGDLGERIRYDYELTVADLFVERFVKAMSDWAEPKGLQSRIQAYGIRADTMRAYGVAHIPETEQLYAGGALDFLKLAGSAAAVYDKPIVTSESLVWMGRDFLTTPLKYKIAADRLLVSGVNQMILHGYPYDHKGYPYPGFQAFSTPNMSFTFASDASARSTFAESMAQTNAYVSRVQYLMQLGPSCPQIGAYYPLFNYPDASLRREEIMQGTIDELDVPPSTSILMREPKEHSPDEQWTIAACDVADQLTANGYNYAHLNEERLLAATVVDGKLRIGTVALDALLLVEQEALSVAAAERVEAFAQAGLPIIFVGRLPTRQPGFLDHQSGDPKVAQAMRATAARYETLIGGSAEIVEALRRLDVYPRVAFAETQPAIDYIERNAGGQRVLFFRNGRRAQQTVHLTIPGESRTPVELDPNSGQRCALPLYTVSDAGIELALELAPFGSTCLLFGDAPATRHAIAASLPLSRTEAGLIALADRAGSFEIKLDDGSTTTVDIESNPPAPLAISTWHLSTTPRAANGTMSRLDLDLDKLTDWREIESLRYCSSPGTYTATIQLGAEHLQPGLKLLLDLGMVYDSATACINGAPLPGHVTHYPYQVDITNYAVEGENTISVEVTPTLHNCLVGYGKQGHKEWARFKKRKHLCPSGLVGPVTLNARWERAI